MKRCFLLVSNGFSPSGGRVGCVTVFDFRADVEFPVESLRDIQSIFY